MALFADRTSSNELAANQLRLWFAMSMAYVLDAELLLRTILGLQGSREWAKALKIVKYDKMVKIVQGD